MNVTEKLKNAPKKRLKDYVAILVDSSSSIAQYGFTEHMFNALLEQDANLRKLASEPDRDVVFHYYTFADETKRLSSDPAPRRSDYKPFGNTNLYGAIVEAINDLDKYNVGSTEQSFLIVAITDGEHNQAYYLNGIRNGKFETKPVRDLIEQLTSRGNWTFVGICPKGRESNMTDIGIPIGNIDGFNVHDASEYKRFSGDTVAATQSYSLARTQGARSTSTFFTDASKVKVDDLVEVGHLFKKYTVPREMRLDTLIEYERGSFEKGKTFYQLTKPEKLASGREILLRDKNTKTIYGDPVGLIGQVRGKLGLPTTGDIRVKPGNHAGFDIFVLSKSDNRLLVRGTDVLYRI